MKINGWLLPALLFFCLISCTKEEFVTDSSSSLEFSTDTVFFDTIFSTVGSVTRQLRVYNPYDKDYKLSRIYLARGGVSDFRLNIDGQQTNSIHDKTIR